MKNFFCQLGASVRRFMWSFIVAYMLGMHNFFKGEEKSVDNILIKIEVIEQQADGTPHE